MINWYDFPTYYDVSFSYEMKDELSFVKKIFREYISSTNPELLEPACGTGRIIVPLSRDGFNCSGFDLNRNALLYLKDKLKRNSLHANIFYSDMVNFKTKKKYDGIYCTVDTFRHLLTEDNAKQHLINISKVLKKNGIYILGLHLIPKKKKIDKRTQWTAKRGRLVVKTTMSMINLDRIKRKETLKVELKVKTKRYNRLLSSIYDLRTYTLLQLKSVLKVVPELEIFKVFDEYYDISNPIKLTSESDYAVILLRRK